MTSSPDRHFRRATETDVSSMMTIRMSVKENTLSRPDLIPCQMYIDYLAALGRGWVCESKDGILGFSYAAHQDSSIWALFVLPEYEGQGIAQNLLGLATEYLFELGNQEIKLSTAVNTRADRFYAAQGWHRGKMKNEIEINYTLKKSR